MMVDRKRMREVVVAAAAVIKISGIVWGSKDGKEIGREWWLGKG
jgi:hypothetical protein